MYPTSVYVARRAPQHGCRALRHAPSVSRQLSGGPGYFPPAPFWGAVSGRHPFAGGRGRADVFDHFDEFVNRSFENFLPTPWAGRRGSGAPEGLQAIWQPKFDVSEAENAYQLRGELPGVDAQNLNVEFTDEKTLVVSGNTVSERSQGTAPQQQRDENTTMTNAQTDAQAQEAGQATEKDADAASIHSESSYVKPSVEDEADVNAREDGTETTSQTAGAPTPNTDNTVAGPQPESSRQAEAASPRYWVSERSNGSFQRTFTFPGRIDSDSVTANLKNGILDIVVPKAKAPEARKIEIQ